LRLRTGNGASFLELFLQFLLSLGAKRKSVTIFAEFTGARKNLSFYFPMVCSRFHPGA
jgi:hypothetical protein